MASLSNAELWISISLFRFSNSYLSLVWHSLSVSCLSAALVFVLFLFLLCLLQLSILQVSDFLLFLLRLPLRSAGLRGWGGGGGVGGGGGHSIGEIFASAAVHPPYKQSHSARRHGACFMSLYLAFTRLEHERQGL